MTIKTDAPKVPLGKFKRTKIIATVGPVTDSLEAIDKLLKAGVNGFRLNFSHGTYEERDRQIAWIREASNAYGKPVAIIQDLCGPKIRLGDFEGFTSVKKGQEISLIYKGEADVHNGILPVQYNLAKKVKRGERLYIADGRIKTIITSVKDSVVRARVENEGVLTQRKGINLPDTDLSGDILTPKDKKDLVYGVHQDIDYVAISFVQTANDVKRVRRMLDNYNSQARLIVKLETKAATENLDEIIQAADGVMVARGDLSTETLPESVPVMQRKIIGKCLEYGKISIVATQMMASMMEAPEPTRAEVSDVATSVIVGADCVMLSDETTVGKYPIETVQMMKRIILYTQENSPLKPVFYREADTSLQSAMSSAVITLAHQVGAKAIVSETKSGNTARSIATHRPSMPIMMITSSARVAQQLALVYGGKSYVRPDSKKAATTLTLWLRQKNVLKTGDTVIITSGKFPGLVGGTDTIKVRKLS